MTVDTREIIRMIELTIAPIRMLPIYSEFRDGQIDMADTIKRLVEIIENNEGMAIAEAFNGN